MSALPEDWLEFMAENDAVCYCPIHMTDVEAPDWPRMNPVIAVAPEEGNAPEFGGRKLRFLPANSVCRNPEEWPKYNALVNAK